MKCLFSTQNMLYFQHFDRRPKGRTASAGAFDDVAVPDAGMGQEGAGPSMGVANDFSLADTIQAIEGRLDDGTLPADTLDDVLPQAAEGMGSGRHGSSKSHTGFYQQP